MIGHFSTGLPAGLNSIKGKNKAVVQNALGIVEQNRSGEYEADCDEVADEKADKNDDKNQYKLQRRGSGKSIFWENREGVAREKMVNTTWELDLVHCLWMNTKGTRTMNTSRNMNGSWDD